MKISVVTTLFNSEAFAAEFCDRAGVAASRISSDVELIFVNDGARDRAVDILLEKQKADPRIVIVDLSRNFGHHRALMTGLQQASGDFVFLIDSDLEEAPELINTFWDEFERGAPVDVVYGVQRKRKGDWFERVSGRIWYRLFSLITSIDYAEDTLTARLMTRRYVDAVISYPERELELRGVFSLAGFEQRAVVVDKGHKGTTTYTLVRKLRLVVDSITSFSSMPLVALFVLGLAITTVSVALVGYLVAIRFIYDQMLEGWVSTVASIWLVGGLVIFSLGIIGIYLAKMFLEIKGRPRTIIRQIHRINSANWVAKPVEPQYRAVFDGVTDPQVPAEKPDWREQDAQSRRFAALTKVIMHNPDEAFTVSEFGCGAGDYETFLRLHGYGACRYTGYDESEVTIANVVAARPRSELHAFVAVASLNKAKPADYVVANGIFNVHPSISEDEWLAHVFETLDTMDMLSVKGFAFNALSKYVAADKANPIFHYADPLILFDHCKRSYSNNVVLLHDYDDSEFAIIVRKQL